jgi:hypothetical protein
MASTIHNGFKGKVTIEVAAVETTIAGLSDFTIGSDERNIVDVPTTFGTTRDTVIIQQKGPIVFTASGFTIFDDEAQDAIRDAYDTEEQLTTIKFYVDETNYYTVAPGDYAQISSIGEVSTSAEGFASFEFSGYFFDDYIKVNDPSD